MADLTSFVDEPMALPLDVRIVARDLKVDLSDFPDSRLLQIQYQAKGRIRAALRRRYSSESSLKVDNPVVSAPIQAPYYTGQIPNDDSYQEGVNKQLIAVKVLSGVFSDQWEIKFTSSTEFSLTGRFSRSQGTGLISSDFTSTNKYILIYSDAWEGTFAKNDRFYFTTNNFDPLITYIASLLTAGYAIGYEYTPLGGKPKQLNPLVQYAEQLLDELADPKSGRALGKGVTYIDDSPVAMPYNIDYLGRNITEAPDEDNWGYDGETGSWEHQYNDSD